MPKGYKTINVSDNLAATLSDLAEETAQKEGLSKVSIAQLIERMVKVYKESQA